MERQERPHANGSSGAFHIFTKHIFSASFPYRFQRYIPINHYRPVAILTPDFRIK